MRPPRPAWPGIVYDGAVRYGAGNQFSRARTHFVRTLLRCASGECT